MKSLHQLLIAIATLVLVTPSSAQQHTRIPTETLVRPSVAGSSKTYTQSSLVMVESRARALGDRLSASGTRYFAVTDSDLIGKTPDEVLKRLSPPVIKADTGLRKVAIVVDVQRPITLFATPDQPANIGTATVDSSGLTNITVDSIINAAQLTIIPKPKGTK